MENSGHFCFQERLYLIDFGKSEHNAEAHSTQLHECIQTCGFEGVTALILPPLTEGALIAGQGALAKSAIASTRNTQCLQGVYYAAQGENSALSSLSQK